MRVHHLAFRTDDLARLERFYADVLGLPVLRRDATRSVWLDAGGTILMLERREPGEPALRADTLELACFATTSEEHAVHAARLAAAGVTIEGQTAYSLYFRDPDGRRVGVSSYPSPRDPKLAKPTCDDEATGGPHRNE